jgi:hypothetical protein
VECLALGIGALPHSEPDTDLFFFDETVLEGERGV